MMLHSLLADIVIVIHSAFVLFVCFGGLTVLRWPRLAWLHIPAAVWGAGIELTGGNCPLTYLENHWRRQAGKTGYGGSFIEHYIEPMLYPLGLTPHHQKYLALVVIVVNLVVYGVVLLRRRYVRKLGRTEQQ